MNKQMKKTDMRHVSSWTAMSSALLLLAPFASASTTEPNTPVASADDDIRHSSEVNMTEHTSDVFAPDPVNTMGFDPVKNEAIYGGKTPIVTERPWLELGRELYVRGPFKEGLDWFGEKNLIWPWLMVFGDWRTAAGVNDNNDDPATPDNASIATQLTLDIDIKLTATERIHGTIRPFEKGGRFTEIDLRDNNEAEERDLFLDLNLDALFFEGDVGAVMTGITGRPSRFDMPFAFGLMPLLVQNGVWIEDAFKGVAFTIPARNSKALNISNYDVTFFAGVDDVSSGALRGQNGVAISESNAAVVGANTFVESNNGYWEAGYGYTRIQKSSKLTGNNGDLDYHNLTVAFSQRFGAFISNSVRAIFNFGQESTTKTADGLLLLVENSLITTKPSTLVPYANFFVGINRPQALARAANAGGVLKNTGINFETDGLTGFPKLTDTGADAYGGAVGVEYLFGLDKQLVIEVAAQDSHGRKSDVAGAETALGVRFQMPISNRFIVRADAMVGAISGDDDVAGVRLEFRWKF